ncbi:MAG: tRNA (adenosine(37)-N6)-threonylcarbamoyltransferase complex dimerization subunit type 1 TsaB [Acidimicrobiales bacterium]
MNVVAIETATETVGVAVRTDAGVRAEFSLAGRRRHVEALVPALAHLLDQVGLEAPALGAVAVDLGPGLFTGLRVGVSAAKGLAQALGIGVVGLSSLDVLVGAAADLGHRGHVLAVIDARRGEVFAALADVGADGGATEVLSPRLVPPAELPYILAEVGQVPVLAVGDGAQRYGELLGAAPGVTCLMGALGAPPAGTLLTMALRLLGDGVAPVPAQDVVPLYMREADARSNFAQSAPPGARRPGAG